MLLDTLGEWEASETYTMKQEERLTYFSLAHYQTVMRNEQPNTYNVVSQLWEHTEIREVCICAN